MKDVSTGEETSLLGSFFLGVSRYLIIAGVLALLFYVLGTKVPLVRYFFEEEPPVIIVEQSPSGLGVKPQKLRVRVTDIHSGIELVRARAEQSRINVNLFSESPPLNTKEYVVELMLDAPKLELRRGNVKVTIEAYDRSLESNGARVSFDIPVRFDAPQIEILSAQHNSVRTGMEFVIYRLKSDKISQTGVRVGSEVYQGFKAENFDEDLSGISDLYFSFFAVPMGFDSSSEKLTVFASNDVGNVSEQSFYYRIRERSPRSWEYTVPDISQARFSHTNDFLELLKDSKRTNQFAPKRYWKDSIPKPEGSMTSPRIGDILRVRDESGREGTFTNDLISLRHGEGKEVSITSPGLVVFAGEVNAYGQTVIIDHGFGLVSVFSALAQVLVSKGEEVQALSKIGTAGFLSHLKQGGYEYGLFFQGTPVRPEEWWDRYWVRDHVVTKVRELKTRFNIKPTSIETESEEPSNVDFLPERSTLDTARNEDILNKVYTNDNLPSKKPRAISQDNDRLIERLERPTYSEEVVRDF